MTMQHSHSIMSQLVVMIIADRQSSPRFLKSLSVPLLGT